MPDAWSWTAFVLGVVAVLIILPVAWLVVRRRWLAQQGWVFDCSMRYPSTTTPSPAWMLGVARLAGERLEWYRVFSLSLRPRATFERGRAQVAGTREADAAEASSLYDQGRIAELTVPDGQLELALAPPDMTTFLSWIEASPPGVLYGESPDL